MNKIHKSALIFVQKAAPRRIYPFILLQLVENLVCAFQRTASTVSRLSKKECRYLSLSRKNTHTHTRATILHFNFLYFSFTTRALWLRFLFQVTTRHSQKQTKPTNSSLRSNSRESEKGADMSGGDVVCSGWLRKSPPEKKLRRYVSALYILFVTS